MNPVRVGVERSTNIVMARIYNCEQEIATHYGDKSIRTNLQKINKVEMIVVSPCYIITYIHVKIPQ